MINWEQFCEEHGIDYKPCNSRGYTQINCIFCGNNNYKGGLHQDNYYVCFVCGYHSINETVKFLTGENWYSIQVKYKNNLTTRDLYLLENSEQTERTQKVVFPEKLIPLTDKAKKYLSGRGFDPYLLEEKYKIKSTTEIGAHCHRIYIPIIQDNKEISWTTRDVTNKSEQRYLSCPEKDEVIPHKKTLYNLDNCNLSHIVLVEGITDCWKLGDNSAACFGIKYTQAQVNVLSTFSKISILFDDEIIAQKQADNLGNILSGLGVEVETIKLGTGDDPGEMPLDEARQLMKEILDE